METEDPPVLRIPFLLNDLRSNGVVPVFWLGTQCLIKNGLLAYG